MTEIECPYCEQPTLMHMEMVDKITLSSRWRGFTVLCALCDCERAKLIEKVYQLENPDGYPDTVYLEGGQVIDPQAEYLMGLDI